MNSQNSLPQVNRHSGVTTTAGRDRSIRGSGRRLVNPVWLWALLALPLAAQVGPSISKHPASLSRSLGDKATLSVSASGDGNTPLSYQWQFAGTPVPGATNRSLTLTNLATLQAGSYTVVVSNAVNAVTSEPAVLDVNTLFRFLADSPVSRDTTYGMAWGDYDNDGFPDLMATGMTSSFLYHNNGDGTFTRNPTPAKAVTGRTYTSLNVWNGYWADYDNDGILDLLVPTGAEQVAERDQLFRGLGNGAFKSMTNAPIATDGFANMDDVWGDFDNDGRLDLFASRLNADFSNAPQTMYWAEADGGFTRELSADFAQDLQRSGYGATAGDFNGDGRRDIAFALGRGAVMIYQNQGGRKFEPFIQPGSGSFIGGPVAADYDNDGDLDLFVTFGKGNCQMLRNDGTGNFELVEEIEPVLEPGRSSNAAWGDYDNDGLLDLFVSRTAQYALDNDRNDSLFHNNGDGTFSRVAAGTVTNDNADGYGCAWADFDNDGFLDLATSGTPSHLFHNTGNANSWLLLKLVGTMSNRSALGARVRVKAVLKGKTVMQLREIGTGAGWSQNDLRAHFGLADAIEAEEVVIDWPSGKKQTLTHVHAKQILTITEPDDRLKVLIEPNPLASPRVTIRGPAGTQVVVERSGDLNLPGQWLEEARTTLGADGTGFVNVAAGSAVAFFRTRVP